MRLFSTIIIILLVVSCASKKSKVYKPSFNQTLARKQRSLKKDEFLHYLKSTLKVKEDQLLQFEAQKRHQEGMISNYDAMSSPTNNSLDTYAFRSQTASIGLKRTREERDKLRWEITTLRSKISALQPGPLSK